MTKEKFTAWAIDTCSDEGHGLIGRYWHFHEGHWEVPANLRGCKKSLFITRKWARHYLPCVKDAFPKAKVKKVTVEIKVEGEIS
jgi:hypothetical protein